MNTFARLSPVMVVVAAFATSAVPAHASTITFETAPPGAGFTGPVTQAGFTYSLLSGGLFVNDFGNPGQDMEGTEAAGGGVLKIVATSGDFVFDDVDFSAFSGSGTGSQTLTVRGFLGASLVGTDLYTLTNTSVFSPKYANWTTEAASLLAGKTLSELDIVLNAGETSGTFSENIDNVVLTPAAAPVPEPATLTLMALGLAGLASVVSRSRRRRASR